MLTTWGDNWQGHVGLAHWRLQRNEKKSQIETYIIFMGQKTNTSKCPFSTSWSTKSTWFKSKFLWAFLVEQADSKIEMEMQRWIMANVTWKKNKVGGLNNTWCKTYYKAKIIKAICWASLMVQWPRLWTSSAGDMGLIPGQGTRSHMQELKRSHGCKKDPVQPHK